MTESPLPPAPLDDLLAHREWVRRMARALVRDENEADDLEQGVWLEAMQRPPRSGRSLRGWFAAAMRHDLVDRRRSESGRSRREHATARSEAVPCASELVAAAEAHKRVVVAVMDLPEPYRSTLLYRYFENLPLADVAAREGVPLETVRTRVRRGVALLRARFDAESPGGRAAWCVALLPLLRSPGAASAPLGASAAAVMGVTVMKAATQIAVGALLVAGAVGWWAMSSQPESPDTADAAPPAQLPPASPQPRSGARAQPPARAVAPAESPAPIASVAAAAAIPPAPAPAPPAAEPPASPGPTGEVAGHVFRLRDRTPVEGATVSMRNVAPAPDAGWPDIAPLTTGATGEFRFSGVPAGTYVVTVQGPGFFARVLTDVKVSETAGVAGLELLLAPGGAIVGTVTDAAGAPMPGVAVTSRWEGPPAGFLGTVTAEDGTFRLEGLPPGRHMVEAARTPSNRQMVTVTVAEGETSRADFLSTATLTGRLFDTTGAAIVDAIIRVNAMRSGEYTSRDTRTDESGAFRLEGLEPGEWGVRVQVLGDDAFAAEVQKVTLAQGEQDVTLRLPTGAIAGYVSVPTTGEPSGCSLSLYSLKKKGSTWTLGPHVGSAFLRKDRTFRFRGLAPGRYRLYAHPSDKSLRVFERDLDLGATPIEGLEVALELARNGTVRVAVHDPDGGPVEGAMLTITKDDGVTMTLQATVEAPGIYVAQVEAGHRTINAFRPDLRPASVTVDVAEGQTAEADVVLKWGATGPRTPATSGEIGGVVLAGATRKPVAPADVTMTVSSVSPAKFIGVVKPNADGRFRFRELAPGKYRIVAVPQRPVYRSQERIVTLTPAGNLEGVEFALEECTPGKVRIVVRDANGQAIEGADLCTVTTTARGRTTTNFPSESPEAGVYLAELETGSRKLLVTKEGFEPATATVTVTQTGTAEVTVVMTPKP